MELETSKNFLSTENENTTHSNIETSRPSTAEEPLNCSPSEIHKEPLEEDETHKVPKEELPIVYLPGGKTSISDTALDLARAYWKAPVEKRMYTRGPIVCILTTDSFGNIQLRSMTGACATSHFELVARLRDGKEGKHDGSEATDKVAICKLETANSIISSLSFQEALPKLNQISNCPVILKDKDKGFRVVTTYDREAGVYCKPSQYSEIGLSEAKTLIDEMLQEYDFASEGDRSRAIAALLSPALTSGGFLNGRAPIMMIQADQSQSGKGYFTKILGAVYSEIPHDISQKKGPGVGNISDKFEAALLNGHNLLILDNLRGKLSCPSIESFITSDSYTARSAYCKHLSVDPKKFFIMATSNGVELTKDLANRTCFICIRKKVGHLFKEYAEGSLKDHIKANSSKYLAAIHAVIKEWILQGSQRTDDVSHDFRDWCRVLDWIVRNIFNAAPLMDGHRAIQIEAEHPDAKWLDVVFDEINEAKATNRPLLLSEIAENSDSSTGFYETEGLAYGDLDSGTQKSVAMQLGRKFARLIEDLGHNNELHMGKYNLIRQTIRKAYQSGNSARITTYSFVPAMA